MLRRSKTRDFVRWYSSKHAVRAFLNHLSAVVLHWKGGDVKKSAKDITNEEPSWFPWEKLLRRFSFNHRNYLPIDITANIKGIQWMLLKEQLDTKYNNDRVREKPTSENLIFWAPFWGNEYFYSERFTFHSCLFYSSGIHILHRKRMKSSRSLTSIRSLFLFIHPKAWLWLDYLITWLTPSLLPWLPWF